MKENCQIEKNEILHDLQLLNDLQLPLSASLQFDPRHQHRLTDQDLEIKNRIW